MARVSQEHLDARRRQIVDGARRSFTRGGFHATSMQDILRETGLSAGAVYRYFRSKDEIISAVAEETFAALREAFSTALHEAPLRPLEDVVAGVLGATLVANGTDGPRDGAQAFPQLIIQVWSEALRNEPLSEVLDRGYEGMRTAWRDLITAYQKGGVLRSDVPADDIARVLMAMCQGLLAQQALFGNVTSDVLRNGLRALLTSTPQD
ncbi:putative HTH-type transcriptional regulator YfiR [Streptomyces sp. RB5]|uniref:Putative HTH-type transcriptional regulator YfiR n=1 Tax=Streptomyces smaragdinus TaxID=2585196 RepID=A0A7K0CDD8_9ACTN|nr:TetR/AcrR family transcriptional regulator [Streptomyces smaragdinus]MQY11386.1 putative HTH-type transcriptional regulator YfiR [Streptomyces smaragdinus]